MWFWLMVIILLIGITAAIVGFCVCENTKYDIYWMFITGIIISFCSAIVVLIMGFCIIDSHTNLNAQIAEKEQVYKSLTYQLENNLYDNDNDVGKKELYNEIKEWNADLRYRQVAQDDFWVGIFYPNIYDQFKIINYE